MFKMMYTWDVAHPGDVVEFEFESSFHIPYVQYFVQNENEN